MEHRADTVFGWAGGRADKRRRRDERAERGWWLVGAQSGRDKKDLHIHMNNVVYWFTSISVSCYIVCARTHMRAARGKNASKK